jgi:prefoldin subunit 5
VGALAQGNPAKEALYGRLQSIESELNQASRTVENAESEVNGFDASIGGLSGRLTSVRGQGYAALSHLDKTVQLLSQKWTEVGPSIKQAVSTSLQPLSSQIRSLQSEAQGLRAEIDRDDLMAAEPLAARLTSEASSLRSRSAEEASRASAPIKELATSLGAVDRDVKIAESTMTLFGQKAFPLTQEESPVFAVEGKLMEGEKPHGTLYFTNHRFLFEGQKEVVLEKHLFIATKKKLERVVIIEKPVGAVQEITKGRVGLIAGTGVFVRFKPEVGIPETPIDVKAWEADVITRFYRYITGGEADRDIATTRGVTAPAVPSIRIARCSACGAPHTGEIYQGQTSVKCEYCGSNVVIG